MRKVISIVLLALMITSIMGMLHALPARALSGGEFQVGRIIDDGIFYNNTKMNGAQIQQFLNAKVPICDTNGTQPYGGTTRAEYGASRGYPAPYTCLKDYRENTVAKVAEPGLCNALGAGNKSAAEMIYEIGLVCGINPQVLIVLLQKEQSLIADDWPWSVQYRSATGYACPDTAPCDAEYYGFFNQVYSAARQFKRYVRDANLFQYRAGRDNYIQYNPNAGCGGTNVYIQNSATAALYNYTPYQPNPSALANLYGLGDGCGAYGNRNFWRMFNDWFGTTIGTPLVRTPSNPTYYLLTNGKKFAIPSGDILYAYGLERTELTIVSNDYLASITDGGMLDTIFTVPGDGTVYLADGNRRYGIASGTYCVKWGLACGTSIQKELGTQVTATMYDGGVLKSLMGNQGGIYLMDAGKKLPFFSEKALTELGYSFGDAISIVNFTNAIRPFGLALLENNSFVKFANSTSIYLYNGNKFYGFPDMETYSNWTSSKIKFFSDNSSAYNQSIPATEAILGSYVTFDGSPYVLDAGKKISLGTQVAQWPSTTNYSQLTGISALIDLKATVNAQSTVRTANGAIYRVTSSQKSPFSSVDDFFALGYLESNLISLGTNTLSTLTNGPDLISEGKLVKKEGSETIYATGPSNTLYGLSSLEQIHQFRFRSDFVPRINAQTATTYTVTQELNSLILSDGRYYVVYRGDKYLIPTSLESTYGVGSLAKSQFTAQGLRNLLGTKGLDRFIKAESGAIYYVDSGTKRPFISFDSFKQTGGNANNTVQLPTDFINAMPTGSSI